MKFRQPYRLSLYDETRLKYLYEEAEAEGKVERYQLGEQFPRVCTPVIVVDKKGPLIGRKGGDYRLFNDISVDYYYPAPEADSCLMEACGKEIHTVLDCVWGFEQIDVDEATSEICATITPFGVFRPKKLPQGVKQGPAIYQHMQDNAFQCQYKRNGEKLASVFFDDTHTGDYNVEEHYESLIQILSVARNYGIQYRLAKCHFFQPEVLLIGFMCSKSGRRADPKKIAQLRNWPEYQSSADINSHLAFANYLQEFLGPDYNDRPQELRKYLKKGADFSRYAEDVAAKEARVWLVNAVLEHCVLVVPDWKAAARPWATGRPFELYLDASDLSWCAALCQRETVGGTPRIIAFTSHSFSDEATRWSAFEREYFCFKEGYEAVQKWIAGFTVFMFFDHKNIEHAESVLESRRASKKWVNWIADTQHILATTVRVWIDGKYNVLADCGSRVSWKHRVAQQLPVPEQPIRDLIRMMFTHPVELAKEAKTRGTQMGKPPWKPASSRPQDERSQHDQPGKTSGQQPSADDRLPAAAEQTGSGNTNNTPDDETRGDFAAADADAEHYYIASDESSTVTYESDETGSLRVSDTEPSIACSTKEPKSASMINRIMDDARERSIQGIRYFGSSYFVLFLEVCAGKATLTCAIRLAGLTALSPIDKINGWDLCDRPTLAKLKDVIRVERPLLTHMAPTCRPFSIAYHGDPNQDPHYQADYILAIHICELAECILQLQLFLCIENPIASRMFNLSSYRRLALRPGCST